MPNTSSWIDAFDARWPGWRRRAAAAGLVLLLETGLLLLLLTLGTQSGRNAVTGAIVSTFDVSEPSPKQETPEVPPKPAAPAPAAAAKQPPLPSEHHLQPNPLAMPPPAAVLPRPEKIPLPDPVPSAAAVPAPSRIAAVIRPDMATVRGPQGAAGAPGDSKRIAGSGPNGEPLYAAQWYREPYRDELTGYLDYVNQPAWALINCQTQPQFRVDHCVLVDEWPQGSNMGRAVLAAAWQFKVRPPRVGGRVMVGEWVRIRIDYDIVRK